MAERVSSAQMTRTSSAAAVSVVAVASGSGATVGSSVGSSTTGSSTTGQFFDHRFFDNWGFNLRLRRRIAAAAGDEGHRARAEAKLTGHTTSLCALFSSLLTETVDETGSEVQMPP
jgi:hypothetical protein